MELAGKMGAKSLLSDISFSAKEKLPISSDSNDHQTTMSDDLSGGGGHVS